MNLNKEKLMEVGKKYSGSGRSFKVTHINDTWAEVRWLNGALPKRDSDRYVRRDVWHLYTLLKD